MSDGRGHARDVVAVGAASLVACAFVWPAAVPGVVAGSVWALFVSPDLDSPARVYSYGAWGAIGDGAAGLITRVWRGRFAVRVARGISRAGRIAGDVWRVIWAPYAMAIPHRSPLSHAPILGTLVRMAYVYAVLLAGCVLAAAIMGRPVLIVDAARSVGGVLGQFFSRESRIAFGVFAVVHDLIHWLRDWGGE